MHAVVLLAHYHALASFVFGSGINPERDPGIANGFRLISVSSFCVWLIDPLGVVFCDVPVQVPALSSLFVVAIYFD